MYKNNNNQEQYVNKNTKCDQWGRSEEAEAFAEQTPRGEKTTKKKKK